MSNKLNLELKQGEDFLRVLTIKDQDGNPVNISGYSFASHVRATYSDELFLSFSFNILNQTTNMGMVEMKMDKALSSSKEINTKSKFVYDVEMNDGGRTIRIIEGTLNISPEVTR